VIAAPLPARPERIRQPRGCTPFNQHFAKRNHLSLTKHGPAVHYIAANHAPTLPSKTVFLIKKGNGTFDEQEAYLITD